MTAAAIVCFVFVAICLAAQPIARWYARKDAELDALIESALEPAPGNVEAYESLPSWMLR